ncbi:unnamed protein product [Musa hybrid cultivar]
MVRLVFRPYTQVRRTICTSVSLRASTRVSSGFASLRHSSPSFGSRHACSNSNPSQKIGVGRRCNPSRGFPPVSFLVPSGFPHRRLARMSDSLVRVSRRVGWGAHWPMPRSHVCPAGHADGARHVLDRIDGIPSNERSVRASAVDAARIDPHPEPSGGPANRRSASDRGASPAPIRFPPGNFKHSLTLFSKSFSSFPRGTCSLSVSRPYLALDGIYRPIGAAFPNNPTRRQRLVVRQGPSRTGSHPPRRPFPGDLGPVRR